MSTAIESAATALATAQEHVTAATDAVTEAEDTAADLHARRDALTAERGALVHAARGGADQAQAALRLAIIDEDLRDLAPPVADADAGVTAARAALAQASNVVAIAQQHLSLATDQAHEAALVTHAGKLEVLLLATINEMAAIVKRRGGRAAWYPTGPLFDAITRLHLSNPRVSR